jgi:hypothetical protein
MNTDSPANNTTTPKKRERYVQVRVRQSTLDGLRANPLLRHMLLSSVVEIMVAQWHTLTLEAQMKAIRSCDPVGQGRPRIR